MKQTGVNGFNPLRLIEAREARGLTATILAELVGVTRQSISAYEKGIHLPSPVTLTKLSEILNLPQHFFLKQDRDYGESTIFFRSLSSATKKDRNKATRKINWVLDTKEYLDNYFDFLPINLPAFNLGDNPEDIELREIENIASKCRQYFGLGNGPISNMVRLLENNGAIIVRKELGTPKLDAFSGWFYNKSIPVVVLNADKESAVRSRINVSHELGHLVFHQSIKKIGASLKTLEKQAWRFAGAFLLPAETFTSELGSPTLDTFWGLKERWKVSIKAMIKRCQDLDIINENYATRLYTNYSRRGWQKTGEPLDDTIIPESPVLLRRCIELLIKEKIKTKEDILLNVSLSSNDLETLTSLPHGYFKNKVGIVENFPKLRDTTKNRNKKNKQKATVINFPPKNIS